MTKIYDISNYRRGDKTRTHYINGVRVQEVSKLQFLQAVASIRLHTYEGIRKTRVGNHVLISYIKLYGDPFAFIIKERKFLFFTKKITYYLKEDVNV